jgi:hypothetical protein
MNAHDLATKPQLVSRDGPRNNFPSVAEMQERFNDYDDETRALIFSTEWLGMSWAERDSRHAEIDARHGYKHGWIIVNGYSFDRQRAFPDQTFVNVWD